MELSTNQNILVQFFLDFRNLHKILNTFEKNMSLRGYFFLKLYTAECRVT